METEMPTITLPKEGELYALSGMFEQVAAVVTDLQTRVRALTWELESMKQNAPPPSGGMKLRSSLDAIGDTPPYKPLRKAKQKP